MTPSVEELQARVIAWRDDDPDPQTRAELDALLTEERWTELEDRFAGRLEFGTAGLRGVLGAGPNRMNLAVVRAATQGFCAYLADVTKDARTRGIVIGYDGRRGSVEFSAEAAAIAAGYGFRVHLFDHVVPTPVLGYACLALETAGGIMVTASHNPPEYNGYKVYWGNGAQIIPPHDTGIAKKIDEGGPLSAMKRLAWDDAVREGLASIVPSEIEDAYHAGLAGLVLHPGVRRDLVIAYTALHGVGDAPVRRALSDAGFSAVHSVTSQAEPDGAFPTVAFPNPEEKGAMDLVLALAAEKGADLVIANDPDADRLAIAAPSAGGGYRQLTGNEVGCLMAHYLLERGSKEGKRLVVSSLVSSPMLGAIGAAHGARWEETLTGFKWIANRAMALEAEGYRFVFGFEEALGYTVGPLVRDKDGVGAALVFADLAAWLAREGRSIEDELDLMSRRYGLYLSRQVSVTKKGAEGAARIEGIMAALRQKAPAEIGGLQVLATQDLSSGERRAADGSTSALSFPPSNVLAFEIEGGHRVMARPSGTEPKIKFYFDVREEIGGKEPIHSARARGEALVDKMVSSFMQRVGEG